METSNIEEKLGEIKVKYCSRPINRTKLLPKKLTFFQKCCSSLGLCDSRKGNHLIH